MTTHATTATITVQLAQLADLPMENLWVLWDEFFDRRPTHHHRTYVESRIAYKLQERTFGALSPNLRRKLEKIGETGIVPNQKRAAGNHLTPGTTLIRDYNGLTHRVTVLADGRFDFQGRPYKSLSAIAKAITGTPWSGPVFFGIKLSAAKRNGEKA
jgi:hypothetical protein